MDYIIKIIFICIFVASIIYLFTQKERNNNLENFEDAYDKTLTNAAGPNWLGETDPDNTLIDYTYFKKNIDAKYMLDRMGEKADPVLQIAPVTRPELGRSTQFKYSDVPTPDTNSTRVPDSTSTEYGINIPSPSTNTQFEGPQMNMEYSKPITDNEVNSKVDNDELWFDKEDNNKKIIETVQNSVKKKQDISQKACKFIGSYDRTPNCPTGYRNFLGASIGAKGTSLMCNDELIESDQATAVASINNGKLENIFITHPGSNYKNDPNIKIVGDGKNASAQVQIKDGKVFRINVTNSGSSYKSTPILEIDKPEGDVFCHLC